jgi:hypothetical protein
MIRCVPSTSLKRSQVCIPGPGRLDVENRKAEAADPSQTRRPCCVSGCSGWRTAPIVPCPRCCSSGGSARLPSPSWKVQKVDLRGRAVRAHRLIWRISGLSPSVRSLFGLHQLGQAAVKKDRADEVGDAVGGCSDCIEVLRHGCQHDQCSANDDRRRNCRVEVDRPALSS